MRRGFYRLRSHPVVAVAGAVVCSLAAVLVWPQAVGAARLFAAQGDPAVLADLRLAEAWEDGGATIVTGQIEAALADNDADLASSFVELADAQGIALPPETVARVAAAVIDEASPGNVAYRFAAGFVTGRADDMASLGGTVAGDLTLYGDIRDVVREGGRLASGGEADSLILGLSAAGIAITAATYATAGAAAPARAGLSMVKAARKAGRIGEGLAAWGARSARGVVDGPALKTAMRSAASSPAAAANAIKASFRAEKAGALVRLGRDVGRITGKAGGRGAMDVLKIADGPKDVARAARLAEKKGGQTRAILKLLGRGALLITAGAFNLALWLFSALTALCGMLISLKATTERLTQRWLDRKKARLGRRRALPTTLTPAGLVIAPNGV